MTAWELFWIYDAETLMGGLEAVVAHLAASPLGPWRRYDLDGMRSWRGFDVERLIIDAKTQRTAFVRVEGEGTQAMLALGKRGEPPTLIQRGQSDDPAALRAYLESTLSPAPLRAGIGPNAARAAFFRVAKGMTNVGGVDLPSWLQVVHPAQLQVEPAALQALGVTVQPLGELLMLELLDAPDTPTDDAVARWQQIAEGLRQG